jgi:spoIIIJ-associated protein
VEWVETTGRTIEEAKDAALDELGVDEPDAEFDVLEEPKSGLFGRLRSEARVRARVRPTTPRPKAERRDRRRRATRGEAGDGDTAGGSAGTAGDGGDAAPAGGERPRRAKRRRGSSRPRAARSEGTAPADGPAEDREAAMDHGGMSLDEQADVATEFLAGLLEAFGVDGSIERNRVDEDTVEVAVAGSDLGLLIGPRGQTLTAVQELARTVVQRQQAAPPVGRLRVDIAGYRQRRKAALERFTAEVAAEVKESGQARALEPMSPPDRKVVHDTVNAIDGVSTRSEGEEPRRRVVIVPETAA